ncbi:MAG: TolC family protein, partial [bacterium]|nr:TolC family protein [bacterium]
FIGLEINIQAEEISLPDAINWGLEQNSSLRVIKDEIKTIERNLALIDTEYAPKMSLQANPIIAGNSTKGGDSTSTTTTTTDTTPKISLETSKIFANGLMINSKISVQEEGIFDLENISENINRTISASKTIYPLVPISPAQEKYKAANELLKMNQNLQWQKEIKKIDFLESYLNLLRLQENLFLVETNYQYAQEDLDRMLKKIKIGEAGEKQGLEAKIALKTAEINLLQAQNDFNQQKENWYLDLNLLEGVEVDLREDLPFLEENKNWVESLELNLEDQGKLMALVVANHYQTKANLLDQENAKKELEWDLTKNKPQINLYGAYDIKDNSWGVGIDLSYNIFDGGTKKLENEAYQVNLINLEDAYLQTVAELRLELVNLINLSTVGNLNLEEKVLSYQQAELEKESYQIQLKQGLISASEFKYQELNWQETEINLKSARDEVFIAKLRLAQFLGFRKSS